jgi:hypothetical protein
MASFEISLFIIIILIIIFLINNRRKTFSIKSQKLLDCKKDVAKLEKQLAELK